MTPQNPAEAIVYRTIVLTWPFYAIGALYVVGPVLGWLLGGLAALSLYLGPAIRPDLRATGPIPPIIWAWIIGMGVMLIALWVGHIDWAYSAPQTIKSTVGWAKGWALVALFPLAGAVLPIRRAVLIRGQAVLGLWTLILTPILLAAPFLGFPERLLTSPLKVVGGPGPEYFSVYWFTWDTTNGSARWQFFAPWSPFAALIGVLQVAFALEEDSAKWRRIGVAAGVVMVLMSKSRMGMVGLVACTVGPRLVPLVYKSWAWMVLAGITASLAALGPVLFDRIGAALSAFRNARADSTRVRATLQRIAGERWQNEAFWFGHGRVRPGAHIVEYMPIGSHHTWWGLLFVKGIVGFLALLIPLVWQTALALIDAAKGPRGRLPLAVVMTLILLSFGENIEIEAYMLWPGLTVLGIHARELQAERRRSGVDRATGLPLGDK